MARGANQPSAGAGSAGAALVLLDDFWLVRLEINFKMGLKGNITSVGIKVLLAATFSLFISEGVRAEEYKCFYEWNNQKRIFTLNRIGNSFKWITNGKEFKLNILSESPKTLILGADFDYSDYDAYYIFNFEKETLDFASISFYGPKEINSFGQPPYTLGKCISR